MLRTRLHNHDLDPTGRLLRETGADRARHNQAPHPTPGAACWGTVRVAPRRCRPDAPSPEKQRSLREIGAGTTGCHHALSGRHSGESQSCRSARPSPDARSATPAQQLAAIALECLAAAYDAGVNFFDNVEAYASGNAEIVMGHANPRPTRRASLDSCGQCRSRLSHAPRGSRWESCSRLPG